MRPRTACYRCRDLKRRCIVRNNDNKCNRCKVMRLQCDLGDDESSTRQEVTRNPSASLCSSLQTPYDSPETVFPAQSVCNELVDLYFDYMHDKQHALFHRPSFIAEQRDGRAPPMLVAAMMALSARFSTNTIFGGIDPLARGRVWADYARCLFHSRPEAVSLTALQACCMLAAISFIDGDPAHEPLLAAQAVRMVQMLDLPNRLSSNWLQREVEIRVWWTIWMMDSWSSAGAKLPKQLIIDPSFPCPMEEVLFETLDPEAIFISDFTSIEDALRRRNQGLWSQMIPLTDIMTEIVEVNESTVNGRLSRSQVLEDVEKIGNKLDSWLLRLPQNLNVTPDNLQQYAEVGHARTLIALHIGFHHHAQILYYQFLHTFDIGIPTEKMQRLKFARRCEEHASELSRLLWMANSTPGYECLWIVTGHLLVISSSVQLHTLLFGEDDVQIENAKTILKQNFEMILNLRKYWPSLDLSMSRLRAFHRACQESMHTSFAMDQWMLLFLQRYMKPVGDRGECGRGVETTDLSHLPTPLQGFGSESDLNMDPALSDSWYDMDLETSGSQILETFL